MENLPSHTNNKTHLLSNSETQFSYFIDFADDYINRMEKGLILTDKKVKFSEQTIRVYRSAVQHYRDFENKLERRTSISEVNKTFLQAFDRYLISTGLSLNSVSLYLAKIKAICNILIEGQVISGSFKSIKTGTEQSTQVYLSENEIRKMKQTELNNSETKMLDIWLIAAFTGLRFSALKKFLSNPSAYLKEYDGVSYIDIISDKTREQSVIPLHIEVQRVLSKYSGTIECPTDQHARRLIKSIARKAGIDQPIPKRITKGGKVVEEIVPKWKLVSLHSGRRSFITNIRRHISSNEAVMSMTGHKSELQLKNYDRSEKLDKIKDVLNNEFFNNLL